VISLALAPTSLVDRVYFLVVTLDRREKRLRGVQLPSSSKYLFIGFALVSGAVACHAFPV